MTIKFLNKLVFLLILLLGSQSCSEDIKTIYIVKNETVYSGDYELNEIKFFDDIFGIACGDNGSLLITNDGGTTWVKNQTIQTQNNLDDIYIFSKTEFYITNSGQTYKTFDGGNTWDKSTDNSGHTYFLNKNEGFSADSDKFYKSGSFSYWQSEYLPFSAHVESIYMLNATRGLAISNYYSTNEIYLTTNAGSNWTVVGGSSSMIVDMDFYDDLHGFFATTDGELYFTSNGGDNWALHPTYPITPSIRSLICIEMTSEVGFVATGAFDLLFSENGSDVTSYLAQDGNSIYFDAMHINSDLKGGCGIFNKEIIKFSK